jgi:hypothetical protein
MFDFVDCFMNFFPFEVENLIKVLLPNIYTVLEMKIEFTSPNQILEFIFIVLNKN